MGQVLVALLSGLGGTVVGCFVTWFLMTRSERNKARREALIKAAQALQDYRVAYGQWYVEYLSPDARASGSWTEPSMGNPDPVLLDVMGTADRGRGRLRVIDHMLCAYFPKDVIEPICNGITKVLDMSGQHADCREVDRVTEAICDLIPDLIRKYSQ